MGASQEIGTFVRLFTSRCVVLVFEDSKWVAVPALLAENGVGKEPVRSESFPGNDDVATPRLKKAYD